MAARGIKATIEPVRAYYGHDWILAVSMGKDLRRFYLGQDAKFCKRVLGVDPSILSRKYSNLYDPKVRTALAAFIIETLSLTPERLRNMEDWELCAQ